MSHIKSPVTFSSLSAVFCIVVCVHVRRAVCLRRDVKSRCAELASGKGASWKADT